MDHPVGALDLVDDAGRGAGEKAHVVALKSAVVDEPGLRSARSHTTKYDSATRQYSGLWLRGRARAQFATIFEGEGEAPDLCQIVQNKQCTEDGSRCSLGFSNGSNQMSGLAALPTNRPSRRALVFVARCRGAGRKCRLPWQPDPSAQSGRESRRKRLKQLNPRPETVVARKPATPNIGYARGERRDFARRRPPALLPLDRPRRLRRHVIHHPVDSLDLVDDAGRGAGEKAHVEGVEVGGHAVDRGHGA